MSAANLAIWGGKLVRNWARITRQMKTGNISLFLFEFPGLGLKCGKDKTLYPSSIIASSIILADFSLCVYKCLHCSVMNCACDLADLIVYPLKDLPGPTPPPIHPVPTPAPESSDDVSLFFFVQADPPSPTMPIRAMRFGPPSVVP